MEIRSYHVILLLLSTCHLTSAQEVQPNSTDGGLYVVASSGDEVTEETIAPTTRGKAGPIGILPDIMKSSSLLMSTPTSDIPIEMTVSRSIQSPSTTAIQSTTSEMSELLLHDIFDDNSTQSTYKFNQDNSTSPPTIVPETTTVVSTTQPTTVSVTTVNTTIVGTTTNVTATTTLNVTESTTLNTTESTTLNTTESTTFNTTESTTFNTTESTTTNVTETTTLNTTTVAPEITTPDCNSTNCTNVTMAIVNTQSNLSSDSKTYIVAGVLGIICFMLLIAVLYLLTQIRSLRRQINPSRSENDATYFSNQYHLDSRVDPYNSMPMKNGQDDPTARRFSQFETYPQGRAPTHGGLDNPSFAKEALPMEPVDLSRKINYSEASTAF